MIARLLPGVQSTRYAGRAASMLARKHTHVSKRQLPAWVPTSYMCSWRVSFLRLVACHPHCPCDSTMCQLQVALTGKNLVSREEHSNGCEDPDPHTYKTHDQTYLRLSSGCNEQLHSCHGISSGLVSVLILAFTDDTTKKFNLRYKYCK